MFRKCLTSLVQSTVCTGKLTPKATQFLKRSVHNGTLGRPPKILITGGFSILQKKKIEINNKIYMKQKLYNKY